MSGARWIYIFDNIKVYEIPHPKEVFKPILELANKDVLNVVFSYETKNRKPYRLRCVSFNRLSLDESGGYRYDDIINESIRDFVEYAFTTAEELSTREDPWTIPDAPVIPNEIEKNTIKKYLTEKYPLLAKNCFEVIAGDLQARIKSHENTIKLIKDAKRIQIKRNIQAKVKS